MGKMKVGRIVKAKVTGITDYGAFVKVAGKCVGLIHISEISSHYVRNIEDYLQVGDEVYCKVLEILDDNEHLKLSMKDVNYRKRSFKKNKILETKKGFDTLKSMLPKWIRQVPKNK